MTAKTGLSEPPQRMPLHKRIHKRVRLLLLTAGLIAVPFRDWTFSPQTIEAYFRACGREHAGDESTHALDDQTWRDLGAQALWQSLSKPMSLFGKQWLFDRLRRRPSPAARERTAQRLRALLGSNVAENSEARETLETLPDADTSIVDWLVPESDIESDIESEVERDASSTSRPPTPTWPPLLILLPVALLGFIGLTWYSPLYLLGALTSLGFILAAQSRYANVLQTWGRECATLRALLAGYVALANLPALAADTQHLSTAKRLLRTLSRPQLVPGAQGYADWFLLANIRHYENCKRSLHEEREALRAIFAITAETEACVYLADYFAARRRDGAALCFARPTPDAAFSFIDVTHPLVERAAPLSLSRAAGGRCWLLSGANGVGKSTLLRTVGLNLVLGRALGICFAREATVSTAPMYASLNNEDSISSGESLYMAELRRAREMLAAGQGSPSGHAAIMLIDEIFRGTNHDEAVATAAAVLETLSSHALVLVSTHHVSLASLLNNTFDAMYLARMQDQESGALVLREGVADVTNGIEMLRQSGFDAAIHARAVEIFGVLQAHASRVANHQSTVPEPASNRPPLAGTRS